MYPLIHLDSTVSRLDEIFWRQKVRIPFDGKEFITTLRDTTGAEAEIRQNQIKKLKKIRLGGPVKVFIEDIYIRGKKIKDVAKEQGKTTGAVKQKIHRDLNKPVLTTESAWARAIESSSCDQNGFYAAAILGGKPRARLILPAAQFVETVDDNLRLIEGGLHNAICEVLENRIRNGRVKNGSELKPMYDEVYEKFKWLGFRMLLDGQWTEINLIWG